MNDSATGTTAHDHADLEAIYRDAESCDLDVFPEMRSNLLLVAGEHYNKKSSSFFRRIRDTKDLTEQQKIRLAKNHTQYITKKYVNSIIGLAPGVGFEPKNESELKDQKSAELHHAVWQDAMEKYSLEERVEDWCEDMIDVGEVATKIFWDPNQGTIKAYHQATLDDGSPLFHGPDGEPTTESQTQSVDPYGRPTVQPHALMKDEERPVYTGAMVFEDVYGFNLLRAPEVKEMSKSPYLIIRKMVNKDELKKKFPDVADKISEGPDETYTIFDYTKNGYRRTKNEVLVKEIYFRPGLQYPQGYFYIFTKDGTLTEGVLPGGIFPIIVQACEKVQTTPRGRSIVKQIRPYQAEINRAASKMAEHQITLGDDKLIVQNGTKVSAGVALPGVRAINVSGAPPTVMPGRDGSQYLAYMQAQIQELYAVMGVAEQDQEKAGQMDPYTLLFKAASQKKTFVRYAKRFERFLINVTKVYFQLAKLHMPEDQVIYAIGRKEAVNMAEFKNADDLCYQIKVVAQSDDIETKMGKQLILSQALQYTASQLGKEDIGKMIKLMPYSDVGESFGDLTLDYDSATNDILAMDRGTPPQIHETDNHLYCQKRAASRMRQSDFSMLGPQIGQLYQQYMATHAQYEQQRLQNIQMAESGLIPTSGYLVKCDFYVSDPKDPQNTKRASIPYMALQWLIEKLETQGQGQEELEQMDQGSQRMMAQSAQPQGGPPNGMGNRLPRQGAGMPGGVDHGNGQQPGNGNQRIAG